MNRLCSVLLFATAIALMPVMPEAQTGFSSGSDGSYGAIDIPAASGTVTLDVPDDGIFHCTTISVAGTLRFNPNRLNTPVYLLATGNVDIAGTISVDGSSSPENTPIGGFGGPGGYQGGTPGIDTLDPGDGHGPGGGKAGRTSQNAPLDEMAGSAAFGGIPSDANPADGAVYGNPLLIPLVGGSGGGGGPGQPGRGGAGGGGAILVASDTAVNIGGRINARGGANNGHVNHGSGGAIRIVSPVITGPGTLDVDGGNWADTAGHGRIRLDLIDRANLALRYEPTSAVSIGSYMAVEPDTLPRLDIVHVAGQDIPEGIEEGVVVFLPFGSDPNRVVRVQARDFVGEVPVKVILVPDSGDQIEYDTVIDMNTGNPATVEVPVVLPVNITTSIYAWTE